MKMRYKNSSILLFIPSGESSFYARAIKKVLEGNGCQVVIYPERPSNKTWAKILLRLGRKIIPLYFASYIRRIVVENKNENFDYVLIVRGEGFSPLAMKILKDAYPTAYFILYAWDLMATTDVRWILKCFDRVISFDYQDALDNSMVFRPLFFHPQYETLKQEDNKLYQLYMVGTITSQQRYRLMKKLELYMNKCGKKYSFYYYIPSLLSYWLAKCKGIIPLFSRKKEYNFLPLSHKEQMKLLSQSAAVVDIPHPLQVSSLNMRPFEAMAAQVKMLTTSKCISKYNFYNEENIFVMSDDQKIEIPSNFWDSAYIPVSESIMNMYSVENWVVDIFDLEKNISYKKFFKS